MQRQDRAYYVVTYIEKGPCNVIAGGGGDLLADVFYFFARPKNLQIESCA